MFSDKLRALFLFLCATVLVGTVSHATGSIDTVSSVRIGIFNSQKTGQLFYEKIPFEMVKDIKHDQLWLNAYLTPSGLMEHNIEISKISAAQSEQLCAYAVEQKMQCLVATEPPFSVLPKDNKQTSIILAHDTDEMSKIFKPLNLQVKNYDYDQIKGQTDSVKHEDNYNYSQNIQTYKESFSLTANENDTLEIQAAKAAYDTARSQFIGTLRRVSEGVNSGDGAEKAREELVALGQDLLENAGSAYLSGFLQREVGQAEVLSTDADAGEAFIHHVQQNIKNNARTTVQNLVSDVISTTTGGGDLQDDLLKSTTDRFILSGAQSLIDAGLMAAKRSDLYALRNLELEYNLNNFENSYLSALVTQPVYQSADLRHNIFFQGGGILNEQSVDIDDDENRHTLNIGAAYRYLTADEKYLIGGNIFYDRQWPYHHSRMSIGLDAKAQDLNFAANYYYPLSDYKDSRRDENGNQYEERALEGYDVELGYTVPFLTGMNVFGKGYQYFRETDEDIRGMELSAEYNIRDNFTLKGSVVEENGGRDGVEFGLQYRIPLYDVDKPNLAAAAIYTDKSPTSVRSRIFEKVRRENRIRVEERLKTDVSASLITAQFNALSTGLPFVVGGVATGSGVNLPFDTAITVPNGDFGIINFSNGALANISASGGGDVILEFNNTTLTVTATNGGFVQFISGSGGINIVNVPGGTVNLLGTDIDVTDDGTTTTVQVRAGAISVVPDVGASVLGGSQADIVRLTIASGATALLVNPALETRQEAAFTNLDLINPSPPIDTSAAPFVNALPALITGPQFVGNNADIRINFTQPVTVSGAPFVNGIVGVNARSFAYNAAASSPLQLVFRHTYIAGDVGAASLTIQNLDLNGGSIQGSTGGLNAVTAYTDTTVPILDQTTPMLLSSSPVDDEPAFDSGGDIVLNFDENIQAGLGNITITDTTDGSSTQIIPIGDAQITMTGSTLTIDPTAPLDLSTAYDVTIPSGVIEDLNGNDFAGIASGALNFTTSNDVTPPALLSSTPSDDDTQVARGSNIVLTFDDNAIIGTGNITIHRTVDDSILETIAVGSGNVTGGGTTTITINPTNDLPPATEVYVLIPATAFEDINGNDFAGITTTTQLSFRTFSPLDLSNITLWLDGEDIDGDNIPEGASEGGLSGGAIATWTDKSGNSNNTIQTIAGDRPAFANPGANFISITNGGPGDFMRIINSGASGQTVIAVLEGVSQNTAGNVNPFLDGAGSDYTFFRVSGTDYKMSLDGGIGRTGRIALDGDSFIFPGANVGTPGPFPTNALLYTEYSSLPTNHEILGGLSTNSGAVDLTPTFRGNYILRELIMYSDTKTSDLAGIDEREQIEGYLAHKYGITARLPAGHPFKTVAP